MRLLNYCEDLLYRIKPENNNWSFDANLFDYEAAVINCNCSYFVTKMLEKYYGADCPNKILTTKDFYECLESRTSTYWFDIRPGDVIAIRHLRDSDVTGHLAIVASEPIEIGNTSMFSLNLYDCTKQPHTGRDTRVGPGFGNGRIRLVTKDNVITGYSWSVREQSKIYTMEDRPIAFGKPENVKQLWTVTN